MSADVSEEHVASIFRIEEASEVTACFMLIFCVPLERRLTLNGRHGVIFKETGVFIVAAVRTSNPTVQGKGFRTKVVRRILPPNTGRKVTGGRR
jgi:hypothetical protein